MFILPQALGSVIVAFISLMSKRVFVSVKLLLINAALAPGKRTVTAILCIMNTSDEARFQTYHRVLNRACWFLLAVSRLLLGLLLGLLALA